MRIRSLTETELSTLREALEALALTEGDTHSLRGWALHVMLEPGFLDQLLWIEDMTLIYGVRPTRGAD